MCELISEQDNLLKAYLLTEELKFPGWLIEEKKRYLLYACLCYIIKS